MNVQLNKNNSYSSGNYSSQWMFNITNKFNFKWLRESWTRDKMSIFSQEISCLFYIYKRDLKSYYCFFCQHKINKCIKKLTIFQTQIFFLCFKRKYTAKNIKAKQKINNKSWDNKLECAQLTSKCNLNSMLKFHAKIQCKHYF